NVFKRDMSAEDRQTYHEPAYRTRIGKLQQRNDSDRAPTARRATESLLPAPRSALRQPIAPDSRNAGIAPDSLACFGADSPGGIQRVPGAAHHRRSHHRAPQAVLAGVSHLQRDCPGGDHGTALPPPRDSAADAASGRAGDLRAPGGILPGAAAPRRDG